MLSTVIFTDGAQKNVEPSNGTDFSLEELRGFVGGTSSWSDSASRR